MSRIVVHDYSGHAFTIDLARALARRGHQVLHLSSSRFRTPKGDLSPREDDPASLEIRPLALPQAFAKDGLFKRRSQEITFGKLVRAEIARFEPDIVLSGNAPLDTQKVVREASHAVGARFIFWLQDLYGEAIARLLPRRLPVIGTMVGEVYRGLERDLLAGSDHIVSISSDFTDRIVAAGVASTKITTIPNWAPLANIALRARDNDWTRRHMPGPGLRLVYSGTLGQKHEPALIRDLARRFAGTVHVFSEGPNAEALKGTAAEDGLGNLIVRPWVAPADLSAMLAGADIALAMIGEDAGVFSVPSKVLTYLAAGKPTLAIIPKYNLAARTLIEAEAGLVSEPGDTSGLFANLERLVADPALRHRMGENARRHAEAHFEIEAITDRFEAIFSPGWVAPRRMVDHAI